ncbi:hypothetical protein SAMN04488115_11828 [Bosea lathyri]|uniref:Uncharacterized protein n=1 Tax=Bosea lathyri TaxID=1036778 RepID=A0A1H6D8F3_9HYPH|nr:hypothetical protein SAMN04488115_11828 [Bosea lathyri]
MRGPGRQGFGSTNIVQPITRLALGALLSEVLAVRPKIGQALIRLKTHLFSRDT